MEAVPRRARVQRLLQWQDNAGEPEHSRQAGENRPLVRKIKGLEPNAQGKLLLEFVPVTRYATVSAIEVVPE